MMVVKLKSLASSQWLVIKTKSKVMSFNHTSLSIATNYACDNLKVQIFNQFTTIMHIFVIIITIFIFGGHDNVCQESPMWVNIISTHQQDRD